MINSILHSRQFGLISLAVIIILLPFGLQNDFHYDIAIQIGLIAATVVGLNLLVGYAGQISLGHAAFFGLGAYLSAILTGTYGWSPIPVLLFAATIVGLLAFIVGRPILRLKGHYLSMATLAVGFIIFIIINNERWVTGGPDGISVPSLSIFGIELNVFNDYKFLGLTLSGVFLWYVLAGILLLLAVWIAQNVIDSSIGRALRSVHGSEVAAQVVGVDTARFKSLVFVISAVYASVMGSFYAHYTGFITPQIASFEHSIVFITMVVLGGMASTLGVILGVVVLKLLPQMLADFQEYEMLMFGLILMLTMIFMPKGLLPTFVGLWRKHIHKKSKEGL